MDIEFLSSDVPLTKTIRPTETVPYPLRKRMTSYTESVDSPGTLHKALSSHAARGHCLLTGRLERSITDESRQGLVDASTPTSLLVLDIDGIPVDAPARTLRGTTYVNYTLKQVQTFLKEVSPDLAATSYVVQFSASMGIKPGMRCHVFFLLDTPVHPTVLKTWLTTLNLATPLLRDNIKLNPAGMSLHYPLDPTSADNGRLIYIAPPILEGVKSFFEGNYIHLVQNDRSTYTIPTQSINYTSLRPMVQTKLDELRTAAGLKKREIRLIQKFGTTIVKDPEQAVVTSFREEGEFVRCNLNGGDSWGYWYHFKAPTVLYNFKDEPNYALEDIDPTHHAAARKAAMEREPVTDTTQGRTYLAFRNMASDTYWNGWYDHDEQNLAITRVKARDRLVDFLKSHGQPVPDYFHDWDLENRFDLEEQFDPQRRWINLFHPSTYLTNGKRRDDATCPPTIHTLITHVLGGSDQSVEHFLNWLAVIFQHRTKPRTAWVLSGTEGTGKGLLFTHVLSPLIGPQHAMSTGLHAFDDDFNAQLEPIVFLMINESELKATKNIEKTMAKLKELITDDYISYRAMHAVAYLGRNFASVLVASNKYDPVLVAGGDRRFNVAPRQELKLSVPSADYMQRLEAELQPFMDYLLSREADVRLAMTPLENDARRQLQFDSQTGLETVCRALRDGDITFFVDDAPSFGAIGQVTREFHGELIDTVGTYHQVVSDALTAIEQDKTHKISRQQMFALLATMLEHPPKTFNKLTSVLKHHGLHSKKVWLDNDTTMAFHIEWKRPADFDSMVKAWRSNYPKRDVLRKNESI